MILLWLLCGLITCVAASYIAVPAGQRMKDLKKYFHYYILIVLTGPISWLGFLLVLAES